MDETTTPPRNARPCTGMTMRARPANWHAAAQACWHVQPSHAVVMRPCMSSSRSLERCACVSAVRSAATLGQPPGRAALISTHHVPDICVIPEAEHAVCPAARRRRDWRHHGRRRRTCPRQPPVPGQRGPARDKLPWPGVSGRLGLLYASRGAAAVAAGMVASVMAGVAGAVGRFGVYSW
jgi:hypothetical protein